MIGVVASGDEHPMVEEFFELFKTPWEFYQPGRSYNVVIATTGELPKVDARLIVIYGGEIESTDVSRGVVMDGRHWGGMLIEGGAHLPIYGGLVTFASDSAGTLFLETPFGCAGLMSRLGRSTVRRVGYDVFREVGFLLSEGQPPEHAHIPTLDIHIAMLRSWIVEAGIPLVEIPPAPAGRGFFACLTHDIDFVGIRNHRFDHSMWGFLYRSTFGAIRNVFRRRISVGRLFESWRAALSLPCVYVGWAPDFWDPFDWYLRIEKNLPATYFLIPFKKRPGEHVPGRHASRRATAYDVADIPHSTATVMEHGCELGVHGIDAWHSVEKGRDELATIAAVTTDSTIGIRMHWLLRDEHTFRILEQAGYAYDSSVGYNETVGYRSGTTQVFRPLGTQALLELPLHIQDGALFYPQRLDLSEPDAARRCERLIENSRQFGGVLTVLWHDRSHGPERFWGGFYARLIEALRSRDAWFGTGAQVVDWFQKRRHVSFDQIRAADGAARISFRYHGEKIHPPLRIRVHRAGAGANDRESFFRTATTFVDIPWNGKTAVAPDHVFGAEWTEAGTLWQQNEEPVWSPQ